MFNNDCYFLYMTAKVHLIFNKSNFFPKKAPSFRLKGCIPKEYRGKL